MNVFWVTFWLKGLAYKRKCLILKATAINSFFWWCKVRRKVNTSWQLQCLAFTLKWHWVRDLRLSAVDNGEIVSLLKEPWAWLGLESYWVTAEGTEAQCVFLPQYRKWLYWLSWGQLRHLFLKPAIFFKWVPWRTGNEACMLGEPKRMYNTLNLTKYIRQYCPSRKDLVGSWEHILEFVKFYGTPQWFIQRPEKYVVSGERTWKFLA